MSLLTFLNDRFIPAATAALPLTDAGFVWGATVTDRLRTFRQKLFRVDDHLRRFRASCERAFVAQPRSDEELAHIAQELIEANAKLLPLDSELSLVIFATPGSGDGQSTLGMQATPLDFAKYAPLFRKGSILEPVAFASSLDSSIKHRSRLAWWIAKEQVPAGSEPLFTTGEPHHFVRETSIANFLAVIDGVLVSSPRSTVLAGISLQVVEEIAARLGVPVSNREMGLDEVLNGASECLLTSTSFCIAPVGSIARRKKPVVGPTFERLLQAWSELVGTDILRQFLSNP